jgi:hypothetical protein
MPLIPEKGQFDDRMRAPPVIAATSCDAPGFAIGRYFGIGGKSFTPPWCLLIPDRHRLGFKDTLKYTLT